LINVQAFAEAYAVGWPGIAYWNERQGWQVQMPTFSYNIFGIAISGTQNREGWAVGRSGSDESGRGAESHGAIYHWESDAPVWKRVLLPAIHFKGDQGLNAVVATRSHVVAVGDKGLAIRGARRSDGTWEFEEAATHTDAQLTAIGEMNSVLYAVGEKGTIIYSRDCGGNGGT